MEERLMQNAPLDEAQIMVIAQHNPSLFAPLYERYVDRVYAYCRRRAANDQDAEDLCSMVFARALAGLHTYQGGMVAAWLFRIAHNVVVNHYRARRQFVPLDDDISTDDFSLDHVEYAADGQLLATLISELPDDQRHLLSLAVDAGLTSQQIGDLIGKNAGTVRVQLHRLFKSLRERFLGERAQ
jgi:RNA polymerase sigma-70 factor (ECF subfamily)